MIRTFIAVKIPATLLLGRLIENLQELGRPVRPVRLGNLHVTLKFLGETEATQIPEIADALENVVVGCDEFLVEIGGLGVFPNFRRPSVVWAGLKAEPLDALADNLEKRLDPLGFPRENRAFLPHLTVARVRGKAPRELATYVQQNAKTDYGSEIVESVELYQSELLPEGSRYTILARTMLGK